MSQLPFSPTHFAASLILSPLTPAALQEIRQLRLKQDGFVREISDLQETVEWKDKKIGVLFSVQLLCMVSLAASLLFLTFLCTLSPARLRP